MLKFKHYHWTCWKTVKNVLVKSFYRIFEKQSGITLKSDHVYVTVTVTPSITPCTPNNGKTVIAF